MDNNENKNSSGALIGILIIILLIALGGYYIIKSKLDKIEQQKPTQMTPATTTDPYLKSLKTQTNSDELTDIQKDLNATDVNSVDIGMPTQ